MKFNRTIDRRSLRKYFHKIKSWLKYLLRQKYAASDRTRDNDARCVHTLIASISARMFEQVLFLDIVAVVVIVASVAIAVIAVIATTAAIAAMPPRRGAAAAARTRERSKN